MKPGPAILDELVCQIVQSVRPVRIILFGSSARGEMGPNSDLDVLVVMPDGCDRLAVTQTLHCKLSSLGIAKDLVVVQASDVEQYGRNPYLIIHSALAEGKELDDHRHLERLTTWVARCRSAGGIPSSALRAPSPRGEVRV